jgi:hypothetical protein
MAGRPLLYKNAKELQKEIDRYFATKELTDLPFSITGLAYSLGFVSRQSFYDYENYPVFSDTVKKARLRIEMFYEEQLLSKNTTGAIFALKNFGWSDKQEITHEIKNELPFNITINHRATE